ncbi:hypothetical protein ACFYM0_03780 [Streptomyces sp. NPDC006487]|uniref:hypothetical protein n=1 Tax=Streptomyces sp. NPDC006487 TaxID=3364748 RepID=UPI0036B39703
MSAHALLLLLLALTVLLVLCAVIGVLGYGAARLGGAPVTTAFNRGAFVFFCALTLGLALAGILLPLIT